MEVQVKKSEGEAWKKEQEKNAHCAFCCNLNYSECINAELGIEKGNKFGKLQIDSYWYIVVYLKFKPNAAK